MGEVVPFQSEHELRLGRLADEVVALHGIETSLRVRHLALSVDAETRNRLLNLAEIIDEKLGFRWFLAEELEDETSNVG